MMRMRMILAMAVMTTPVIVMMIVTMMVMMMVMMMIPSQEYPVHEKPQRNSAQWWQFIGVL